MRILGLDLGTSFFKGAVLDLDAQSVSDIRRVPTPSPVAGLPSGHHELDPSTVISRVEELLKALLTVAPDAAGLAVCGQMHCVVPVDSSGRARSNIITWKDQRGVDGLFGELQRLVTPDERRQIGRELRIGLPIVTLSWLRAYNEIEAGLTPTSLADFVMSQLCETPPTTEATNAAAYGLFDVERGVWHDELIEKLGLADLHWPRIRPFGEVVGTAEINGRRLSCFTPVGDQQCALAGAELVPRELSLNISTGSQISLLSSDPSGGEFQVRPYFGNQWLRTIVQIPAGRSLQVLVSHLTEMGAQRDPWEYIARRTEQTPTFGKDRSWIRQNSVQGPTEELNSGESSYSRSSHGELVIDLAFFASEFGSSGSIANIREDNLNVGNLFVAAFRSMAENYARCAERLSPVREWDRVVFSGGLAQRFKRLRREILERFGNPQWRVSEIEEDTLHGLMTLARRCRLSH